MNSTGGKDNPHDRGGGQGLGGSHGNDRVGLNSSRHANRHTNRPNTPDRLRIDNLVFEGGGIKGIAAVGAMEVLGESGGLDSVVRVGGTSAGAINALIHALGYSIGEQLEILSSTDFEAFLDESFGVIRDLHRLATDFGWHRGEFFRGWLGALIAAKLGDREASFADLKKARGVCVYVVGTNLSTGFAEVFSHETHPTLPLVDAVRISMSIPLFFQAVRLGPKRSVYVDGGVQLNYPIRLFDHPRFWEAEGVDRSIPTRAPNPYTLGIRLDNASEMGLYLDDEPPKHQDIDSFTDFARALVASVLNQQSRVHLDSEDWARTVYVDTLKVGTTDFGLSEAKKQALVEQGRLGAQRYMAWRAGLDGALSG